MEHSIGGVGVFTIPQNPKQNNAVLLFTDLLSAKIRSKLFIFYLVGSGVEWWVRTQRPSERAASANIPSLLRCVFTTSVFSRDLKY